MNEFQQIAKAQAWKVAKALNDAMGPAKGNHVWSPACIASLLAIAREGASGTTRYELEQMMGDGSFLNERDPFGLEAERKWCYHGYDSSFASAIWLSETAKPQDGFVQACKDNAIKITFGDLRSSSAGREITEWIATQTRGLLSPLVNLSSKALACLVSALYLKDAWDEPFEDCNTVVDTFHSPDGDVDAAFMRGGRDCRVVEGRTCIAVAVSLSSYAEICFALPIGSECDPKEALKLFEKLSNQEMECEPVILSIPRFECETSIDSVESLLEAAGIGSAAAMELQPMVGISPTPTQIVHGAKLSVNEEGIEAGAYTTMPLCLGMPPEDPPKPREMMLDKPFHVAVLSRTGAPLFVGSIEMPSEDVIVWRMLDVDEDSLISRDEEIEGWGCRVTIEAEDDDWESFRVTCEICGRLIRVSSAKPFREAKAAFDSIKKDLAEFVRLSKQGNFDSDSWIDELVAKWH